MSEIEIRFVERMDPDPTRPSRVGIFIKVLQYRQWRTDILTLPELGYMQGWGEWKDVPTEKEE